MEINRILIIDDNIDHADGLGMVLEDEGYSVMLAYSGAEGLQILEKENIDLVLLDAKLPDANGIRIYKTIMEKKLACCVVIITGFRIEQLIKETIPDISLSIVRTINDSNEFYAKMTDLTTDSLTVFGNVPVAVMNKSFHSAPQLSRNIYFIRSREDIHDIPKDNTTILLFKSGTILQMLGMYLTLRQDKIINPVVLVLPEANDSTDILKSFETTGCMFKPFSLEKMITVVNEITEGSKANAC